MSAEKTEKATPKRKRDERDKGNISRSQDLTAALALTLGCCLLFFFSNAIISELKNILYVSFTHINPKTIEIENIIAILSPYIVSTMKVLIPFLITMTIFIIIVLRLQVGSLLAIKRLKPNLEKFSMESLKQGFSRIFNPFKPRNLFELVKSILKLIVVGFCGYSTLMDKKELLLDLLGQNVESGMLALGSVVFHMVINMCVVMLIIGFIDKKFQDWQYEKSIKMSKQEIKDEHKNLEGDPKIKSKIRSAQMQMMNQKMMSAVSTADVVVANPTHFSVAIKYDKLKAPAPIVVAKGVDFMAFKIREIAKNNKIPIVENKPLARTLYKLVKVNGIIPAQLYTAVAEVLAWVYNRNERSGRLIK